MSDILRYCYTYAEALEQLQAKGYTHLYFSDDPDGKLIADEIEYAKNDPDLKDHRVYAAVGNMVQTVRLEYKNVCEVEKRERRKN